MSFKWVKSKWFLYLSGAVTAAGAAVLLDALFLEKYFFRIKKFNIGKATGKHVSLLLITDLHLKKKLSVHHGRLAAKLNKLKPDLVLIAGDTLDEFGELASVEAFFGLISPEIRKVAIPGNHDHKALPNLSALSGLLQKHNCDFLINQTKIYNLKGSNIAVTGLDDCIEGEGNLPGALAGIGREENHIMLIHSPVQQESVRKQLKEINAQRSAEAQINLQYIFAGHNHGGQVRLPWYVPVLPAQSGNYVHGWYNNSPPYLFLSKGFGTSALPFRFFARSEVVLFKFFVR